MLRKKLVQLLALLLIIGSIGTVFTASAVGASTEQTKEEDAITRLYIGVLDRQPDAEGLAHWRAAMQWPERGDQTALEWVQTVQIPLTLLDVADSFISSEEFSSVIGAETTEEFVALLYEQILRRDSDPAGAAYWISMIDSAAISRPGAVLLLTESPEFIALTGTVRFSPGTNWTFSEPGWVDAGNGIALPQVLLDIRYCESRNDYRVVNPRTGDASGGFQFLSSSWHAYGHAARFGVSMARDASYIEQDIAALGTYLRSGKKPWYESRSCWG